MLSFDDVDAASGRSGRETLARTECLMACSLRDEAQEASLAGRDSGRRPVKFQSLCFGSDRNRTLGGRGATGRCMLNRSFWKGRKVFLTGHTGFKGSWLSLWLDALGANVTGYALDPPTQPNLFEQADVAGTVPLNSRRHSRLSDDSRAR